MNLLQFFRLGLSVIVVIVATIGASAESMAADLGLPDISLKIGNGATSTTLPVSRVIISDRQNPTRILLRVDLKNFQDRISTVLNSNPAPSSICSMYGSNIVSRLDGFELTLPEGQASLSGIATLWECRANPVNSSRVEWKTQETSSGVTTKVPVIVSLPGDPIVSRVADRKFRVYSKTNLSFNGLDIKLATQDTRVESTSVRIAFPGGQSQELDLKGDIQKLLDLSAPKTMVTQSLPDSILPLKPRISDAKLTSKGLDIDVVLEAPSAAVDAVIQDLAIVENVRMTTQWRARDGRMQSTEVDTLWAFLRRQGVNASAPELKDYVGSSGETAKRTIYFWFEGDRAAAAGVAKIANNFIAREGSDAPKVVVSDQILWQSQHPESGHRPGDMSLQIFLTSMGQGR